MPQAPTEIELMAYADGELTTADAERVRRYIEANAFAARKVQLHKKLREAGRRALGEIAVPAGLLARLEERTERAEAPIRLRMAWISAIAAVLVIGIGLVFWAQRGETVVRGSPLVPIAWVTSTAERHIDCSKHVDQHFVPGFPRKLEELPASLGKFLGKEAKCPDLSKMGYTFAGCGPCPIPGGKTAHLLYKRSDGKPGGCVSLFVQKDEGQIKLENGKVYFARDDKDATPMIIWRGDGVVYFLVGEENAQLTSAAKEMGLRVRI